MTKLNNKYENNKKIEIFNNNRKLLKKMEEINNK